MSLITNKQIKITHRRFTDTQPLTQIYTETGQRHDSRKAANAWWCRKERDLTLSTRKTNISVQAYKPNPRKTDILVQPHTDIFRLTYISVWFTHLLYRIILVFGHGSSGL